MNDLTKNPHGKFNGNEQKYVTEWLEQGDVRTKKSFTTRLEEKFNEIFDVKHSIAVNSGTSGLHAALIAAGVGQGDEVISPAYTVIMDSGCTIMCGATPVFADIDPKTHIVDPVDVERKITPKTKAIMAVSMHGLPIDMDPIMALANKHKLVVIEDSAQTLLGKYKGKWAGTLGHIGMFSFENKKHVTSGSEGGMLVTNDSGLAERARKFAGIGYKHLTADAGRTSLAAGVFQNPEYERFGSFGLNYRMAEVCAAVGLAQAERMHELVERRIAIGRLFESAVQNCAWIEPQYTPAEHIHSYYTFACRYYGNEKLGVSWREFYNAYIEQGGDGFYGACLVPYLEPAFRGFEINGHKYQKGLCPVAESIQPLVMQFKTNYRDMDVAKRKADVLHQLVNKMASR